MRAATPFLPLIGAATLAACAEAEPPPKLPPRDPAVMQALFDQLMIDADLAGQNEANAALTSGIDHSLPPFAPNGEAIREARAEAVALVGGEAKLVPPQPDEDLPEGWLDEPLEAHILAAEGAPACARSLAYSARWGAMMPDRFPIFPRAALMNAAGATREGCPLRAVTFQSGNTRETIAAFYRAKAAGFETHYAETDDVARFAGRQGEARFALELRPGPSGQGVEATLLTYRM